ncbi:cation transporter [Kistimonas asteriae]|uniref:cation transporter n=1 Tax=Kistimonas asteriae TaxID=517724 RepID=UPI001BA7031B|nr:cation transporter [Kistimonas asteriae]
MLTERKVLCYSVVLELFFGITGIMVALYSDSSAVLLDGGYSLLCTLTMLANVKVARLVTLPVSAQRPFGSATLEPLMLLFESLILLALCSLLLSVATYQIVRGGNLPAFDLALIYEVFSTLVGGATAMTFLYLYRKIQSPLIYFEYQEWVVDASVSATAMVAFALACFMGDTHPVTPYIDSVLTLLLLVFLIRLPVATLRKNFRQLLLQDIAEPGLTHALEQALAATATEIGLLHYRTHVICLGRWLWVNIEIGVPTGKSTLTHDDVHLFRRAAEKKLQSQAKHFQLNIVISPQRSAISS